VPFNNTSWDTHSFLYKIVTFLTVMPRGVVLGAKGSTHSPLRVETSMHSCLGCRAADNKVIIAKYKARHP
jgi:hypothetical protein